jgi:hypothetical protein
MKRWTIGCRSKNMADLLIDDNTVSMVHAELIRTDDGKFQLIDRKSTNGTARFLKGRWVRISQAFVSTDEKLRFGRAVTTIRNLLRSETRTWQQELFDAWFHVFDPNEIKNNINFALRIFPAPALNTIRVINRKETENPFSFMIFGILLLSASKAGSFLSFGGISGESGIGSYETLVMIYMVVYYFVTYKIFQLISNEYKVFDDYLRIGAIVNGLYWMLLSVVNLAASYEKDLNEKMKYLAASDGKNYVLQNNDVLYSVSFILMSFTIVYMFLYQIVLLKKFWNVSYFKTITIFLLTNFIFIVLGVAPIFF